MMRSCCSERYAEERKGQQIWLKQKNLGDQKEKGVFNKCYKQSQLHINPSRHQDTCRHTCVWNDVCAAYTNTAHSREISPFVSTQGSMKTDEHHLLAADSSVSTAVSDCFVWWLHFSVISSESLLSHQIGQVDTSSLSDQCLRFCP